VAQNARYRSQRKLPQGVSKKAELDSECLCFDDFVEGRFEVAAKLTN
jgi:hypothetical protein